MKKPVFATVIAVLMSTAILLIMLCVLVKVGPGATGPALAFSVQVSPTVAQVNPASALAVDPSDPLVLYAGAVLETDSAYSGVYKTIDGGKSWQQLLGELRVSGLAIDPLLADTV